MPKVHDSQSAYQLFISVWNQNRIDLVEEFKVLLLNRAMHVIGVYHAASGSTSGVVVDTKLILVSALKTNAHSIIMAHNHPSGNLKPSPQDCDQTQKMKIACKALDIEMADHLIITNDGYYSFGDGLSHEKKKINGSVYFECQQPF
ncbi:MAG: hypothetical protein BGO48_14575 [Mucilaginibacter sp. 44-25]|nr:MAG: hypothetical protein BGO48_14575 [Mucilaginibacter sp. 44-25]